MTTASGGAEDKGRAVRPVAIFVGKGALRHGNVTLQRKFAVWSSELDAAVVGVGATESRTLSGVRVIAFPELRPPALGGLLFYSLAPVVAAVVAARKPLAAVVCQSPLEGVGAVAASRVLPKRRRPFLVVELHGDWRSATSLYGHRSRRLVGGVADRLCRWALKRADLVRSVSEHLETEARAAGYRGGFLRYPTYSDYDTFTLEAPSPLPAAPQVACIGALELSKGSDVLIESWATVAAAHADARLVLAGDGALRRRLERRVAELGLAGVSFLGTRPRSEIKDLLDKSSLVVLPSRTEGLPRVLSEAFGRGRPVVATRVGGTPDLVEDGRNGYLVPPDDAPALAETLTSIVGDREHLVQLGSEARRTVSKWDPLQRYHDGIRELSRWLREAGSGEHRESSAA